MNYIDEISRMAISYAPKVIGAILVHIIGFWVIGKITAMVQRALAKESPYVLDEPAQALVVASLGDSSVNLATRPFAKSEHYWDTFFYMQEHVKKEFDKAKMSIPFPQMDVNHNPA